MNDYDSWKKVEHVRKNYKKQFFSEIQNELDISTVRLNNIFKNLGIVPININTYQQFRRKNRRKKSIWMKIKSFLGIKKKRKPKITQPEQQTT